MVELVEHPDNAGNEIYITLVTPIGDWSVSLPIDDEMGCYHITSFSNWTHAGTVDYSLDEDAENVDDIHVCDLDAFIEMLQEARRIRDAVAVSSNPPFEGRPPCTHTAVATQSEWETGRCQACGASVTKRPATFGGAGQLRS